MDNLNRHSNHYNILCVVLILIIACIVSSMYRGIFSDDSRDYMQRADSIYFEGRLNTESDETVSSFFYPLLIALSYWLVGHTLLASHLFPFLLAIAIPPLLFLLLNKRLHHVGWASLGAIVYMSYPTNIVWLNQNLTEPVFAFCVVITLLLLESAPERPALFIVLGATSSLAVLTRLFDGVLFTGAVSLAILYQYRRRLPWKWLAFALFAFIGVQLIAAEIFDFSLLAYRNYFHRLASENAKAPASIEPLGQTIMAAKTYLRWYFAEKWALFPMVLLLCGIWQSCRKNLIQTPLHFIGYATFIMLLYGRRSREVLIMRNASATIPALTILLIVGAKYLYDALKASKFAQKYQVVPFCFLAMLLVFWGGTNVQGSLRFIGLMSDIIPSSSLWQIIRTNPAYPPYVQGNIVPIRENIIKDVLGDYRPSYRSKLAQTAWENNEPQKEREQADFAYHETFNDGLTWKTDAVDVTGTSPLWTDQHPGYLGAFPYQSDGTVVYKFSFPQKAKKIVLSDIHAQWSPGDIVRMWTSEDGQKWTLRHDDNLRFKKTYYHQVLTEEIIGTQTLYIKYYFYAGDAARDASDNRGASLDEWSLAVTFQNE